MSGRVEPPPSRATSFDSYQVTVSGVNSGFRAAMWTTNGAFSFSGLDPDDLYAVGWETADDVPSGWLGQDGSSSPNSRAVPPMSGLILRPTEWASVGGRIQLPPEVSLDEVELVVDVEGFGKHEGAYPRGSVRADGTFLVSGIEPGSTGYIKIDDRRDRLRGGWYTGSVTLSPVERSRSAIAAGDQDVLVVLEEAATIEGTVVLGDQSPAESFDSLKAKAHGIGDEFVEAVPVGRDGRFVLGGLVPSESYTVRVGGTTSQLVSVESPARVTAPGAVTLTTAGRTWITVRVSGPGVSAQSVGSVRAFDEAGVERGYASVDRTGTGRINGLQAGRQYRLQTSGGWSSGWYVGDGAVVQQRRANAVSVAAGGHAELVVVPQATLSGRLAPSRWTMVEYLDPETGELVDYGYVEGSDYTVDAPAGTYKILVDDTDESYAPSFYSEDGRSFVSFDEASEVTFEPQSTVEGVLLRGGRCASYSGRVELDDRFVEPEQVKLWSDAPGSIGEHTGWIGDPDPRFTVRGLAPGTYHVAIVYTDRVERQFPDVVIDGCTATTGVVLGDDPGLVQVEKPTLTGESRVGSELSVSTGSTAPAAESFDFEWRRSEARIPGADGPTYVPTMDDVGHPLSVVVTARRSGYRSVSYEVDHEDWVPAPEVRPGQVTVDGQVRVGGTLRAGVQGWPQDAVISYRWARDGWTIVGHDGPLYPLGADDVNARISVTATAQLPRHVPASAAVTTAPVELDFLLLEAPRLTTGAVVGTRLSVDELAWSAAPDATRFQWLRDGRAITGATAAQYTPVAADQGTRISVRITGKLTGFADVVATTSAVQVKRGVITERTRPTVSGTARVGETVRVTTGSWSPSSVTLSYRWLRDGVAISGASGPAYRLRVLDAHARVSVRVTASRPGFGSVSDVVAFNARVGKVRPDIGATFVRSDDRSRITARVTVAASGVSALTGRIRATVDSRSVWTTLRASAKGKVTLLLPARVKSGDIVHIEFTPTGDTSVGVMKRTVTRTVRGV
ncbi:hypothetical protein [Cellulomonas persica]|nr:hypothetical protein [Cellulomonas persica]